MKRIITGICCAVLLIFGMSSCGSRDGGGDRHPIGVDCISNGDFINNMKQCQITMNDTRRVTCLVYNDKTIDCDWFHADGTDAHISDEGITQ